MKLYGGLKADDSVSFKTEEDNYKYEFMGEYKYLPSTFVNETWNRADEYQRMYEQTFKVNQDLLEQQREKNKETKKLKEALAAAQTVISQKDDENQKLRQQIDQHKQSIKEWEEKEENHKAKTVRAHEKIIEQGRKVKALEKECAKLRREFTMFMVDHKALLIKTEFMEGKIATQAKELEVKDQNLEALKTINQQLKDLIEEANEKVKVEHAKAEGSLNNVLRYRRKLYESYERDADVLRLLQQLETNVTPPKKKTMRKFCKWAAPDDKNVTAKIVKELLGTFSEASLQLYGATPICF